jgi:hypothetical protein
MHRIEVFLYAMAFVGRFGVPRPPVGQPVATKVARTEAA